jgi:Zeta toxin
VIWSPDRNAEQGRLVTALYAAAVAVLCERSAIMAGGLPGTDRMAAVAEADADLSRYLTVSVDAILVQMAAGHLIPDVAGLLPMEAADLAQAEAQFIGKRVAMRALADGRNLLLEVSMAARPSVDSWLAALHAAGYTVQGVFADITIEESVRLTDAAHRRGEEELRAGRGHGGRYIPADAIRALAHTSAGPDPGPGNAPAAWYPGGGQVAALIAGYHAGHLPLDELARDFRSRRWASVPRAWAPGLEHARAAIDDLKPVIPGTFDDVAAAYDQDQISDADYTILARAAAAPR